MKKCENVTLIGEKSLYSEPLILKNRPATYIFIILMNPAKEYLYTREIREKFKVGIFLYP